MNYSKRFGVKRGSKVDLAKVDASFTDEHESHAHALPEIEQDSQRLHDLQYLMYAEGKRSLLICLQGRDAAGKDGTINHVLGAMNPQGCTVTGFKQRIDDPARHWKISDGDYAERPFWDAYTEAFEDAISKCSTEHAPWFIIPSNHKWFRNLAISRIVAETLESLGMKFPEPTVDIEVIKQKYHAIVQEERAGAEGAETDESERKQGKKGAKKKKKKKS